MRARLHVRYIARMVAAAHAARAGNGDISEMQGLRQNVRMHAGGVAQRAMRAHSIPTDCSLTYRLRHGQGQWLHEQAQFRHGHDNADCVCKLALVEMGCRMSCAVRAGELSSRQAVVRSANAPPKNSTLLHAGTLRGTRSHRCTTPPHLRPRTGFAGPPRGLAVFHVWRCRCLWLHIPESRPAYNAAERGMIVHDCASVRCLRPTIAAWCVFGNPRCSSCLGPLRGPIWLASAWSYITSPFAAAQDCP